MRRARCLNCEQIACYDAELVENESEIGVLKSSLEGEELRGRSQGVVHRPQVS